MQVRDPDLSFDSFKVNLPLHILIAYALWVTFHTLYHVRPEQAYRKINWENVMVNFMHQLDGQRDVQIAGKTWFLGVSVRVSPEKINIWNGRQQSKEDGPHQCRWASSNLLSAWIEQKEGGRANLLSLLELGQLSSSALGNQCSWFWGLQTRTGTYTTGAPGSQACQFGLEPHCQLSWASSLQMADCGTSQPP